jgi:hypothetical protein
MNEFLLDCRNISELKVSDETRILSLSDIHGDIHSLIIALRDCGEVITKPTFVNDQEDPDLENLLNIDISEEDNGYVDTLNYNWIGGNTHIVIIGDFLDMNRDDKQHVNGFGKYEYPQIEIKIFRFINAINKQAKMKGGAIIKMFGNHEMNNIIGKKDFIEKYSYPNTIQQTNYYRNNNRFECFMRGKEGYTLMLEDGMYILFKINNNIFVHGGPVYNLNFYEYNKMNYIINNKNDANIENLITILATTNSPLWIRDYGEYSQINKRIYNNEEFCNNVKKILTTIKGNDFFYDDIKTIRIIIGHCVQSSSTLLNKKNTTFNHINKEKSNNIKEVLEPKLEVVKNKKRIIPYKLTLIDEYKNDYLMSYNYNNGILTAEAARQHQREGAEAPPGADDSLTIHNNQMYDVKYRGNPDFEKRIVFGITMECDNDFNSADNYIYKVDIGSSRGFDSLYLPTKFDIENLSIAELENKYFLSRTPQILEIINNKPKIIRSLVNNTKIHQPRDFDQKQLKTKNKTKKFEEPTILEGFLEYFKKIF